MLYILSSMILGIGITLFPKTEKTLNLIKTILMEVVAYMAYNTFVCYCLNFMNIPITLLNLSIINLILAGALLYQLIKKKKVQSYHIGKKDILVTLLLIMVVVVTIGINFRGISRIRYISMDAFAHYKAAREFSENTTLFSKATENTTTSKCFMPMGYVNVGLLFKVIRPYVGTIALYRVYILFEAMSYFYVGMLFYFCIQPKMKTKAKTWVGVLFSVFYVIGYPLNALISGFHYLILGILYVIAIFEGFTNEIEKETMGFVPSLILITLLNTGLIFSYALFCPFVYGAELIYLIKHYRKEKKKLILFIGFALLLTGLMGCDISLYQRVNELGAMGIGMGGWIYQNNFSNMILFLPFTIYYLMKIRKESDKRFEKIMLLFFAIFFIILLVGTKLQLCSNYYYYKNYYILWFLMLYMSTNGLFYLFDQKQPMKYLVMIFCLFYSTLFLLFISLVETPIQTELEAKQSRTNFMEIYTFNKTNMAIETPFVSKEELQLLKKLEECIENDWKKEPSILMLATTTQEKWLQSLTGYYHTIYPNGIEEVKKWNKGEYEYLLLLEKRNSYEALKNKIDLEDTEIIIQNEAGILYKTKKGK